MNEKDFSEAVFLVFGVDRTCYQLGLTKVFFRAGKQELLEQVLSSYSPDDDEANRQIAARFRSILAKKRIKRVMAAVMLLVRLQIWINHLRLYREISGTLHRLCLISQAFSAPLSHIHKSRAIVTLQAAVTAKIASSHFQQENKAVVLLQRYVIHKYRGKHLRHSLAERVSNTNLHKQKAALVVFRFFMECNRRKSLLTEISKREQATKQRKQRLLQLEQQRREAEEKKRQDELEQLRLKAQKEEEERRKKEHEEHVKREQELALLRRKQEEEQQRLQREQEEVSC